MRRQYEDLSSGAFDLKSCTAAVQIEQDLRFSLPSLGSGSKRILGFIHFPVVLDKKHITRMLQMELFSSPWWSALLAIVLIDLVLAGDNAIVIALAARNLPPHLQKKAIMWGTVGAIAVRSAMTLVVVWLLKIPGLMLIGGLGLLWIAYKLLVDTGGDDHDGPVAVTF